MIRECIECGIEFNDSSTAKKRVGGRINECPDCSDEHVVRYLGVQNAAGKMSGCEILAFANNADRDAFNTHWRNNSGMHKGKSCQLGTHTIAGSGSFKFKRVAEFGRNDNHKGRAE
jgi:hypothetical protein